MATCNLMPWIKSKFFDDNNNPLVGGKVYTYLANSQVPAVTYTDYTCSTANANPIILDSRGEADIWMDTELVYKVVVKNSLDVEVWSVDGVKTSLNGGGGGGIEFVTSDNTNSVEINGLGTNINPLSASVRVSDLSLNALSITSYGITSMSSGLYVPDLNPRLTSVEGAVVSLDSRVTTNETNIATNTSNIATNTSDIVDLQIADKAQDNQVSTGVAKGLIITKLNDTQIQISSGEGYSVDRTDGANPVVNKIEKTSNVTHTIVNLASQVVFIFLDSSGNVVEHTTQDPTRKYDGLISLGAVVITSSVIVGAVSVPNLAFQPMHHLLDLNNVLGIIRNGATLSKVNNTLNIAQASGYLFIMGANYKNATNDPNRTAIAQESPKAFTPSTPIDLTATSTTTIDVTQWWNPTTQLLETLDNNKWTIIRFYQGANLGLFAFYGQAQYSTKDEAIKSVSEGTYPFQNHPILASRQNAIYLGDLIIQKNMANLNNASYINSDILGLNASGGASVNPVWGQITGTLSNQTDLQSELSTLQSGINTNASDITALDSRVSTNETDIFNNQTAITNLQNSKQDNLPNGVSVLNYLGWSGTNWIARNIDYSEIQNPPTIPTNYVTTDTTQTNLSGDKTWTGLHTFSGGITANQGASGLNIYLGSSGGYIGTGANPTLQTAFLIDATQFDMRYNGVSRFRVTNTTIFLDGGLYKFSSVPTNTPSFYYGEDAGGNLTKFTAPLSTPTLQQVTDQGASTNVVSSFTTRLLIGGATDDLSTALQVNGNGLISNASNVTRLNLIAPTGNAGSGASVGTNYTMGGTGADWFAGATNGGNSFKIQREGIDKVSVTDLATWINTRALINGATDDGTTALQVNGNAKANSYQFNSSTAQIATDVSNNMFLNFGTSKQVKLSNTGFELYSFGSQVAHLTDSGELFTDNTIRSREGFKLDVAQKRFQFFTNSTYITDAVDGAMEFRCASGYRFNDAPTGTIVNTYGEDALGNLVKGSASGVSSVTWQFGRWFNSALYNDVAFPPSINWGDDGTGNPLIALRVAEAKTLKIVTFEAVQNSTTSFDLQIVKNGVGTTIGSITSTSHSFTGLSISISAGDKIYFKATNVVGGATIKGICIVAKAE